MTEEEAQDLLNKLSVHYKQPVMPLGRYCEAFRTWAKAITDNHQAHENADSRDFAFEKLIPIFPILELAIVKSNLLARLLYDGESLRTEKCPKHQGHWSGCSWPGNEFTWCDLCYSGSNITGWLRTELSPEVGIGEPVVVVAKKNDDEILFGDDDDDVLQ